MENFVQVRPQHLNHYGYLFGGQMLFWVDEFAWIKVAKEYPGLNFVTVGMDSVKFTRQIKNGSILKFLITEERIGTTSVTYNVKVFSIINNKKAIEEEMFSTNITFVRLGKNGKKAPILENLSD